MKSQEVVFVEGPAKVVSVSGSTGHTDDFYHA